MARTAHGETGFSRSRSLVTVLRTALRPKWLGLFAVMVGLVVAFVELGAWQLDVARSRSAADAVERSAAQAPSPLQDVLRPHQPFRSDLSVRRVTVDGAYADGQVLVGDRRLDGRTGWWVVAPLRTEGGTIGVLRGFVTDPNAAPPPPSGEVHLAGALAPGESPAERTDLPPGRLGAVDLSVLVQQWPGDLDNAFVFATAESGAGIPTDLGLTRVPPPPPVPEGLTWRNAAYALQWWLFAAFAVFMWFKMVRDAHLTEEAALRGRGADDGDGRLGKNGPREPAALAEPRDH
jgi:cytochrome oxidase assembly protein ShyY1